MVFVNDPFQPDFNRYGLALHTSSAQLGLSLSNFAGDTRTQTWDLEREVSSYLHQYLAEFLLPQSWQDLAFIAAARGPGSFTSTRIGLVTARTLAQQLDLPLFAISSLAALAQSQSKQAGSKTLLAMQMQATRGQLYVGIYQTSGDAAIIAYLPDTLTKPETWQETLKQLTAPYQLWEAPTHLGMTATSLLEIAYGDWQQGKRPHWSEAVPFY
jgi:tRNA threonylcarbamoyl adenosine modification protein YeaZ